MHRLRLVLTAALLPLAAFTQTASQTGIQSADVNRIVRPCVDFCGYANGAWRAQNRIPASMDRWSRRWQAGENNREQLRAILGEVSQKSLLSIGRPM